MKHYIRNLFFISALLILQSAGGQTLQRSVVSSFGGGSYQLIFTGGQSAEGSYQDSALSVVFGFQQPVQIPIDTAVYASPVVNVCGNVYKLTAGKAPYYQWYKDNQPIPGAVSGSLNVRESGLYKVVFFDGRLTYIHSRSIRVYFRGLPDAVITTTSPLSICSGQYALLKAPRESGNTYQWRKSGQIIPGGTSPDFRATETGVYSVVVTSRYGCVKTSAGVTVRVNSKPVALVTSYGSATVCAGKTVLLRTSGGSGNIYKWKRNGVVIPGAETYTFPASATGVYTVEITSPAGCVSVSPGFTVRVNPLPVAIITAYGPTTICSGKSVTMRTPRGSGFSYQWKRNGTNISGATGDVYQASISGSYSVAVTGNTGCTVISTPVIITVLPVPVAKISVSGSTVLSPGKQITLRSNSGTGFMYQWKRNGNKIQGATSSSYQVTTAGNYTVVITNSGSCFTESLPVVITVNNSAVAGRVMAGKSVVNNSQSEPYINVYPNPLPAGAELNLDMFLLTEDERIHLTVSDMNGKLLKAEWLKSGQQKISIPGASGIYVLDFRWGNNERRVIRVYKN